MSIEEKTQRLEELYKEIEEINNSIKEERLKKQKEYIGKYFKITDEDEFTIGKILSVREYGLGVIELYYDHEECKYSYSSGLRNYNELTIITKEEFLREKMEFMCVFEECFI